MKHYKIIIIIVLCFLANITFAQNTDNKAENLGIVSELVYLKLTSENLAIRIVNDTLISEQDKIKFVNLYNDTKVITDQIIVQLISDCRRKNRLKYLRKLDKLFVSKTISQVEESDFKNDKLKGYVKNLKKANIVYSKLIAFKTTDKPNENPLLNIGLKGFFPAAMSMEELTGVLSFITGTIKDIRESKEKKVEKLTNILNDLRLSPLQDLAKGEKKEAEKKDEKK